MLCDCQFLNNVYFNKNLYKFAIDFKDKMSDQKLCTSCKKRITNTVGTAVFPCPKCAKEDIIRCAHCREIVAKYTCSKCGFTGPN